MPSSKPQLNVRVSPQCWEILDSLLAATGLSRAMLVEQGLRLIARREGIPVPPTPPARRTPPQAAREKKKKKTDKGA